MGARVNCAIQTNIHQGVPSALIPATDNYPSRSNCSSCAALTAGCIEQHGANSAAARLSHSSSIGTPRFARFAVRASHPTRVLHKYTDDAATAAPILCTLYVPNRSCATPRPVRLPRSIYLCGSTIAFSTSIAMRLLGHGAPASRASCTPRTRLGRTLTRVLAPNISGSGNCVFQLSSLGKLAFGFGKFNFTFSVPSQSLHGSTGAVCPCNTQGEKLHSTTCAHHRYIHQRR